MEFIENLGHTIKTRKIQIDELSKGGWVVLGTTYLTRSEIYEVMGVLQHEIRYRDKKLNKRR